MRFTCVALFLVAALSTNAQDAKPIRLIAEGEDFKVEKPGWQIIPYRENYFASTFAISFLSRLACLGAPAQVDAPAVATQNIVLPSDGEFLVFARFEQPFNFAVEFTVEIEQNGKTLFSQIYGKLEDPKYWALNNHVRKPMERYWWGGTDNIVWQEKGSVKLAKGPAVIRLIAGPQLDNGKPRAMAAKRHVDAICLTNDAEGLAAQKKTRYLELDGWLTQAGDLFVRFTNPKDAAGPIVPVVEPNNSGQHSPYYVHVRDWPSLRVGKTTAIISDTKYHLTGPRSLAVNPALLGKVQTSDRILPPMKGKKGPAAVEMPESEQLKPGESSAWVDVGQVLDSLFNCQWIPKVQGPPGSLNVRLEFAVPDGKGGLKIIRDMHVKGVGYETTLDISGNIAPNPELAKVLKERFWMPEIRTLKESLEWLHAEVVKFPKKGSVPKRLLVYNIMGFGSGLATEEGKKLALALGDNTAVNQEGKKRKLVAHWPDPKPAAIDKNLEKAGADVKIVSYGDEIHLPAFPLTDDEFDRWLKERSVNVQRDKEFKAILKTKSHPLYFYAQLSAKEKGGKHFAAGTEHYALKGILTGANYSPHANYLINEMDYVRPFKLKAMSMPWAEDYVWQIPEFSVQVTGYLTSGLRCGAKYHDMPIHMYVMPHSPGNTPRDFRLSFYTAIGHGAKIINYFCASPSSVGATENYVETADLGMWKQIHHCTHEAGVFEDYVLDGKVRPAKVGLLLSPVDDVLTGSSNSTFAMHNNERKAIYYALRHAQVPVDFVTEDDLIEGLAKDYRVIYVNQQWMHSKALAALQRWVEAGGTAVALAGGGFHDEFQKPNPAALAFYGVKSQALTTDPNLVKKYLLEENRPFLTKQDLPVYVPIDTVKMDTLEVPVIVWKQILEPNDAKVLGTYKDGKPAVLEKRHGKGRVVLFGFLPGQAYLKSGLPLLPPDRSSVDAGFAHFLPTTMDANLRRALVDAFLPTDFVRPVTCSEPLVETTCIDTGGSKLAVPLINFTGKHIDKLTVHVSGLTDARKIRSVERGELSTSIENGGATIVLPLDVADMLLIDR
jgi:hypothetical protein